MEITLEKAIEVCREIEELLKPIGYHCGLTGSCLYAGKSEKDVDIIIYPHLVSKQLSLKEILNSLKKFHTNMYPSQSKNLPPQIAPSTMDKLVVVGDYDGIRIDLFFLE